MTDAEKLLKTKALLEAMMNYFGQDLRLSVQKAEFGLELGEEISAQDCVTWCEELMCKVQALASHAAQGSIRGMELSYTHQLVGDGVVACGADDGFAVPGVDGADCPFCEQGTQNVAARA